MIATCPACAPMPCPLKPNPPRLTPTDYGIGRRPEPIHCASCIDARSPFRSRRWYVIGLPGGHLAVVRADSTLRNRYAEQHAVILATVHERRPLTNGDTRALIAWALRTYRVAP
jgi:hypothetical protein